MQKRIQNSFRPAVSCRSHLTCSLTELCRDHVLSDGVCRQLLCSENLPRSPGVAQPCHVSGRVSWSEVEIRSWQIIDLRRRSWYIDLLHGNFYLLNSLINPPLTPFNKTLSFGPLSSESLVKVWISWKTLSTVMMRNMLEVWIRLFLLGSLEMIHIWAFNDLKRHKWATVQRNKAEA